MNDDGYTDILSGSYSRMSQPMAGTFQVLWGDKKGEFANAETLKSTDDKELELPATGGQTDNICTRPFAADINNDGNLDIVSGNFRGTFYVIYGEGKGNFDAESKILLDDDDKKLSVDTHSDPFLVDWDQDGDLDILSGSGIGGVFLSINEGSKSNPKFGPFETILKAKGYSAYGSEVKFGDDFVTGPQTATRVWADDVNGDGKLDILVGDAVSLVFPADGVSEDEAREKLKEWQKGLTEISSKMQAAYSPANAEKEESADIDAAGEEGDAADEKTSKEDAAKQAAENMKKIQDEFSKHYEARDKIVRDVRTGYVWVMYQK